MNATVLILWFVFLNSGNAEATGGIQTVEYTNLAACEVALAHIQEKSKYIAGVCTTK